MIGLQHHPGYAIHKLRTRLNFLEAFHPPLYDAFDEEGNFITSFFESDWVTTFLSMGFEVRPGNPEKEKNRLRSRIAYLEALIVRVGMMN